MASNNKSKRLVARRLKKIKQIKEKIHDIILVKDSDKEEKKKGAP